MPFLGAHESVSGGLHMAFARIDKVGGQALQIFTRNQRQWRHPPLATSEVDQFLQEQSRHEGMIVASHASYLVNLAAGEEGLRRRSIDAFVEELRRCEQLQVPYVVLHPGAHGGDGLEAGLARLVTSLDEVLATVPGSSMVLLETTAGQGTGLGGTFEELALIRQRVQASERIGVCLDTCHVFAAGYDIRSKSGYQSVIRHFDESVGLQHLRLFHLNDSKKELGSRVDRHEHIGAGCIGVDGFRWLVNDDRFTRHAMILETPKGDDLQEDIENLQTLRRLLEQG
ncbi:deoxyribonuclease IV [Desulfofustis limnaeus]|jgi:deoxyribonuclease-4|uniref:Probable endonuclease 4 n=1 Tax=Desulfofustis limnaeus TaxID=2740163 RepID=A0ABM7WE53_9BACT|nr:deoxyribonuclease IV [Desulfofustis limnaeus]MDX9895333.1 deoxyribonuclease IV [Desulfofustis sp.]BDD89254.1 putative endonuclease 4 [Desulfofustis limnaeus]